MNNLLRTLTESQVKPATDLRLLLTTVKEARKQVAENKLTDPFYDSLDGLLQDLKTITVDNRDAEAFLKPVSKTEWPDYYEVISNPMDFQTMLKKVKQRSYRSKREFKDDLDLIWTNCYTFNSAENHPLRRCVDRLKVKAERLLHHITDRKDRHDPSIPSNLPSPPAGFRPKLNGVNGHINGRSSHTRSPSITIAPTLHSRPNLSTRRNVAFTDSLAIVRTPEGMATFYDLDKDVGSSNPQSTLSHRLREMAPTIDAGSESEDDTAMAVDCPSHLTGDKRKLNGISNHRPRKRARFSTQYPTPLLDERDDLSQLWWGAVQSDQLLANGLPGIPFGMSSSTSHHKKLKRKRPKRPKIDVPPPSNPKSLLAMMNNNVKTMRRVRHTHNKLAALTAATAAPEDEEGADGAAAGLFGSTTATTAKLSRLSPVPGYLAGDDDVLDEKIDECPWTIGRGRNGTTSRLGGIEVGQDNAMDCMQWSMDKVLEHSGFQGASKIARNVLADTASEYLLNIGRTLRFLVDRFGKTMNPEEIILHALFESGASRIQDLERFISDDVERYGSRLGEVEKKLVSAYRETTAGELLEDEGLFEEESDGENGALAIGDFADVLGEDYLGLRELGIADEFGLSGLTVPRRLLKGRKGHNKPTAAKPTEPPPPYPPPPPFVPFAASDVDDQIGLLKPFFQQRFASLAAAKQPPSFPSSLPGPTLSGPSLSSLASASSSQTPVTNGTLPQTLQSQSAGSQPSTPFIPPELVLPDDGPNPAQVKMSPIGQIVKTGASAAAAKKKAAKVAPSTSVIVTDSTAPGNAPGAAQTPTDTGLGAVAPSGSQEPKKKKASTGVGSGNARKKKDGAGSGTTPTPGVFGGQGSPSLPAIVAATA